MAGENIINERDPHIQASAIRAQNAPQITVTLAEDVVHTLHEWTTIQPSNLRSEIQEASVHPDSLIHKTRITFSQLYTFLVVAEDIFYRNEKRRFDFTNESSEQFFDLFFGTNPKSNLYSSYTNSRLSDDVRDALILAELTLDLLRVRVPPEDEARAKEIVTEEDAQAKPKEEEAGSGGIPVPFSTGKKKPDEEEEKKKDEEKEKEPREPGKLTEEELRLAQHANRATSIYRNEVIRLQELLLNNLASTYGVEATGLENFRAMMRPEVTRFIQYEMDKLDPNTFLETLKSPDSRLKIYTAALMRMQQSGAFRARLLRSLPKLATQAKVAAEAKAKAEKRKVTAQDIEEAFIALDVIQHATPETVLAGVRATDLGEITFSTEQIESFGKIYIEGAHIGGANLHDVLVNILRAEGVRLTESQIRLVINRLETYALLGKTLSMLDERDIEKLFEQAFSYADASLYRRLATVLTKDTNLASLFAVYAHQIRAEARRITGNESVGLASPIEPTEKVIASYSRLAGIYGTQAVAMALYEPKEEIQKKLEKASEQEAAVLQGALEVKFQLSEKIALFNKSPALVLQHILVTEYGFDIVHAQAFFGDYDDAQTLMFTQQVFGLAADPYFGFDPSFAIFNEATGQLYYPGEDGTPQFFEGSGQALSMVGSAIGGQVRGAANQGAATLGKAAFLMFTGPEGAAFLLQMKGVSEKLKIFGIDLEGELNKAFAALGYVAMIPILAALGAVAATTAAFMGAGSLIGNVIGKGISGIMGGSAGIASSASIAGQGLLTGAQGLVGGAFTATTGALATFGNTLLGGLASASVTSGLILTTFTSILGFTYLQNQQKQMAFLTDVRGGQTNRGSRGVGISSPGCFPVSGRISTTNAYEDGTPHAVHTGCMTGLSGSPVCPLNPDGTDQAIDIAAPPTDIYAPFDGLAWFYAEGSGLDPSVAPPGVEPTGYGNHIQFFTTVDGHDLVFIYGHLQDFAGFRSGESAEVHVGDIIGTVDSTGGSSGNHLHYEVLGANIQEVIPYPVSVGDNVISECDPASAGVQP